MLDLLEVDLVCAVLHVVQHVEDVARPRDLVAVQGHDEAPAAVHVDDRRLIALEE